MKNLLPLFISLYFLSGCLSTNTRILDKELNNENHEQILFFSKKPTRDFDEKVIIEIYVTPRKEKFIFKKFKDEMEKYKLDAVIDIKSTIFTSNLITTTKYVGIGIKYKN